MMLLLFVPLFFAFSNAAGSSGTPSEHQHQHQHRNMRPSCPLCSNKHSQHPTAVARCRVVLSLSDSDNSPALDERADHVRLVSIELLPLLVAGVMVEADAHVLGVASYVYHLLCHHR